MASCLVGVEGRAKINNWFELSRSGDGMSIDE